MPMHKSARKYQGVLTPYMGMHVYTRAAKGMPGSTEQKSMSYLNKIASGATLVSMLLLLQIRTVTKDMANTATIV